MEPQTGETLLDKLLSNKDPRIMEAIKSKKVNDEEIDEWRDFDLRTVNAQSYRLLQECMLARCLYQGYENGVFDLYSADLVNKESLFMRPTFLETAVDCDVSGFCLKNILLKVFKVDESWQRAEDIARKKHNMRNIKIISRRREYLINKAKEGYSRLKIAVWENDPDMIEYVMNNQSVREDVGQQEGARPFITLTAPLKSQSDTAASSTPSTLYLKPEKECGYINENTDSRPTSSSNNDTNPSLSNVRPDENINTSESINSGATSTESDDNIFKLMSVPRDD